MRPLPAQWPWGRIRAMTDYDAIVVGAGHNGLTAATILQRAGLRTVCLEVNTYCGGMAATVELIDGFRYEIAGSVQFPTASEITKDLGLDTLPAVEPDVMSTNIGESGEEAMVFYRDPIQLMTHLGEARLRCRHRHGRIDRLESGAS